MGYDRALEKVALQSKSRRSSRGSYEYVSVRLTKTWYKCFQWLFEMMCWVILTLKQVLWCFSMIKLAKMPPNVKSSDRFRTVFDSAVLCQFFQAPSHYNIFALLNYVPFCIHNCFPRGKFVTLDTNTRTKSEKDG